MSERERKEDSCFPMFVESMPTSGINIRYNINSKSKPIKALILDMSFQNVNAQQKIRDLFFDKKNKSYWDHHTRSKQLWL